MNIVGFRTLLVGFETSGSNIQILGSFSFSFAELFSTQSISSLYILSMTGCNVSDAEIQLQ